MSADLKKNHIVYVTPTFPFGSGESFIKAELVAWTELGYSISVIPFWPRGKLLNKLYIDTIDYAEAPLFALKYIRPVLKCFIRKPVRFLKTLVLLLQLPSKFHKNMLAFIKGCAMSQVVCDRAPAHIHAHFGGTSSTMAMVMSEMLDIPWSMTCHRWDIYECNLLSEKSHQAAFTRFISEKGMSDAVGMGVSETKSILIPMGVEKVNASSARQLPAGTPTIMCAANLIEVKGHKYLLEAVAKLKKDNIPVNLKIAGNGVLRSELEIMSKHLDIDSQVEFLGHISQLELFRQYTADKIDLFVLPSIDLGHGCHEGIPVSLMEAMSYAIPVISTRTGSIEELLDPAMELAVPQKDSSALARKIGHILTDPDVYESSSQQVLDCISGKWLINESVAKMKMLIENHGDRCRE